MRTVALCLALLIGNVARSSDAPNVREIEVVVDGGYKPSVIEVAADESVRLKFVRKEYTPCTKQVVFPSLGITRELPVGEAVVIDIPPQKSGEVAFRCGMNMVKGKLTVKAKGS